MHTTVLQTTGAFLEERFLLPKYQRQWQNSRHKNIDIWWILNVRGKGIVYRCTAKLGQIGQEGFSSFPLSYVGQIFSLLLYIKEEAELFFALFPDLQCFFLSCSSFFRYVTFAKKNFAFSTFSSANHADNWQLSNWLEIKVRLRKTRGKCNKFLQGKWEKGKGSAGERRNIIGLQFLQLAKATWDFRTYGIPHSIRFISERKALST